MNVRPSIAAWIALISVMAPVGAQEAEVEGDLAKLQGRWTGLTKIRNGGTIVSHLEFKGDRVVAWIGDMKGIDGPGDAKDVEKGESESRVILDDKPGAR